MTFKKTCTNSDCAYQVDESFVGKCPKCGTTGWKIDRAITETPVQVNDFVKAELKKMDPKILASTLKTLSEKQDEIRKTMEPLSKIMTPKMVEQMSEINDRLKSLNLDKIKIPKFSFKIEPSVLKQIQEYQNKQFTFGAALAKAADDNPELKEVVESKNEIETAEKTLDDVSEQVKSLTKMTERNFKDVGDRQEEHHTEQMAEHQKTRDELLIDNGRLQEKINTLQEKVKNSWKSPKNWSIGFAISIIAGLVILAIQSLSQIYNST